MIRIKLLKPEEVDRDSRWPFYDHDNRKTKPLPRLVNICPLHWNVFDRSFKSIFSSGILSNNGNTPATNYVFVFVHSVLNFHKMGYSWNQIIHNIITELAYIYKYKVQLLFDIYNWLNYVNLGWGPPRDISQISVISDVQFKSNVTKNNKECESQFNSQV